MHKYISIFSYLRLFPLLSTLFHSATCLFWSRPILNTNRQFCLYPQARPWYNCFLLLLLLLFSLTASIGFKKVCCCQVLLINRCADLYKSRLFGSLLVWRIQMCVDTMPRRHISLNLDSWINVLWSDEIILEVCSSLLEKSNCSGWYYLNNDTISSSTLIWFVILLFNRQIYHF